MPRQAYRIVDPLALRSCVPCRGGTPPLTSDQIGPLLAQLDPGWTVAKLPSPKHGSVEALAREYRFETFGRALEAAVAVGKIAEEQQHHPDLHVAWGRLRIEIWTHKIGGLTESDFILAAKCDATLTP